MKRLLLATTILFAAGCASEKAAEAPKPAAKQVAAAAPTPAPTPPPAAVAPTPPPAPPAPPPLVHTDYSKDAVWLCKPGGP